MLAVLSPQDKALALAVGAGLLAVALGFVDLETTTRLGVVRDWNLIVYGLGVLTGGAMPLVPRAAALRRALAGR